MTEPAHLNEAYDLDATAAWIREGGHARVALQMPDELLHTTRWRWRRLSRGGATTQGAPRRPRAPRATHPPASVRLFVLADTTFGSCCVDEVAAAHHDADAIVHFGRACMSPPVARLPARFVFNKVPLDADACAAAIAGPRLRARRAKRRGDDPDEEARVDGLVVLVDQEHAHLAAALIDASSRRRRRRRLRRRSRSSSPSPRPWRPSRESSRARAPGAVEPRRVRRRGRVFVVRAA